MRWKLAIFPLLLLVALAALPATATTYFAKMTGDDTMAGTSAGTAWAHFPGMVGCTATCAATTPAAGDILEFIGSAGTYTLAGTWVWPAAANGSAGNVITVKTTGVNVTVTGGISISGASFTTYAGTIGQCVSPGTGAGACNLAYIDLPMTGARNCPTSGCIAFDALWYENSGDTFFKRRARAFVNGNNRCTNSPPPGNPILVTAANVNDADALCNAPIWGAWQASTAYAADAHVFDSNGNVEVANAACTSGGSAPAWPAKDQQIWRQTTDNTCTWTAEGSNTTMDGNGRPVVAFKARPATNTSYQCFNQAVYSNTQLPSTTHAPFQIELINKGSWSAGIMRPMQMQAVSGSLTKVTFQAGDSLSGSLTGQQFSGCVVNNWYEAYNVKEQLKVAGGGVGEWYLDPCPTTDPCSVAESTWRLWIAYTSTEDLPTMTFMFSQISQYSPQLLIFKDNSYITVDDLTFQMDGFQYPLQGIGTSFGGVLTPPAVGIYGTSNHITIGEKGHPNFFFNINGHGLSMYDTANNNMVQYNVMADMGGMGLRGGYQSLDSDTTANVWHDNTWQQNIVTAPQQTDPSGEGGGCYMGDGFNNQALHNTFNDTVSGMCNFGTGLHAPIAGKYVFTGNHFEYNKGHGRVIQTTHNLGLMSDFGAVVHAAPNWSPGCPLAPVTAPTGWPNVSSSNYSQFCNFVQYNIAINFASDYNSTPFSGSRGLYCDGGCSVTLWNSNIVGNIGQMCMFNNLPNNPNLGAGYDPAQAQYNLFVNNLLFGCGAAQYASFGAGSSIISRGGLNNNAFSFLRNVAIIDSTNGEKYTPNPTKFGCFDYETVGNPAWACSNNWFNDYNAIFDIAGGQLTTTRCTVAACTSTATTNIPPLPWGTDEDVHSLLAVDPGIASLSTNNYALTNSALLSAIGWTSWDTSLAGAYDNTAPVPPVNVSIEYPQNTYSDTQTDFLNGYNGNPLTLVLGGTIQGGTVK